MTLEFTTDNNDILTFQLYAASQSASTKKKRKRNKITVPLFYGIIAVFFITNGNPIAGFIFLFLGLLWIYFYPRWETKYYLRHYRKFVSESYGGRDEVTATLDFQDEFIYAKDPSVEAKVQYTELAKIVELPANIFLYLKAGTALNIPTGKIKELNELKAYLKSLAARLNIKYISDEKWMWK